MSKIKRKEDAAISSTVGSHGGSGEFEDPPANDEGTPPSGGGPSEFASPESDSGGESSAEPKVESQALIDFKTALEERLAASCTRDATQAASAGDESDSNVVGVGFSSGGEEDAGGIPGQPGIVVFVAHEASQEEVRREIMDSFEVRAASDDSLPIQVVVTGIIDAYSSNRSKFRPAPAGVSVGHFSITAGTIGGWARGRGSRANRLLMVSNNHVLAASNRGRFGDSILQPGTADGGTNPASRIAILERFVPVAFGAGSINYVDCATGWCWPNLVRTDHVYHSGSSPVYFRVGSSTAEPRVGMLVGKTGRTTNLTQGRVTATGVSINVNFGAAGVAHFRDQFAVRSVNANPFSAGGDSGSFVWAWDARRAVVGLLFAGGGGTTFCNRINRVIPALDITLI